VRVTAQMLLPLLVPAVLASQAMTVEEPPAPSLLSMFVRPWATELSLGDLRATAMRDSALEVRFWEGFGLGGVRSVVLRRGPTGRWTVLRPIIDDLHAARIDTIEVSPSSVNYPGSLWPMLVHMGIDSLPTRVSRKWRMLDGHTYVLEVRRGTRYRASEIEHLDKPEAHADVVVRRIADVLRRYFNP